MEKIRDVISEEPFYFAEIVERFSEDGFQSVGRALGALHEEGSLWQDQLGKFCLVGSKFAAEFPMKKNS